MTEFPMVRNGTGFLFFCLWDSEHSVSLALQWDSGGPSSAKARRLPACFRVAGTSRGDGGMSGRRRVGFGIPCIPAEEHTCPEPDINQLFQEQRNGFGLWNLLPAGPECTTTWDCETGKGATVKLCSEAVNYALTPDLLIRLCCCTCSLFNSVLQAFSPPALRSFGVHE